MDKSKQQHLWMGVLLLCACIIGAGVYLGLEGGKPSQASDRPAATESPGVSAYDASQPERTTEGITVYVTRTGSCYHRGTCSYLRSSKIPMKLSEAKKRYRPCSRCNPPR